MNANRTATALAIALTALAACSKPAPSAPVKPASTAGLPAGAYVVDKAHTSLNFRVSHMGFSRFTARFTRLDGTLNLDPAHPAASSVTVSIDPKSLQTNYPDPKTLDFDAQLTGPEFLDAAKFPKMTYRSTQVILTGPDTARIVGDLTFHGVTRPVTLEAKFNGGYGDNPMDPSGARVGFSAHGSLKRSDFGVGFGVPAPGTTMGVGDEVEVLIEAEFTRAKTPTGNGTAAGK